ncbi:alcohol dehydrogenase [Hyaloscypha variabilis]
MAHFARALVAPAVGGPLEFRDVLLDTVRPDEALIEIHAVGICHADISCLNGKLPVKFPIVFGHEGSGMVKEVGSQLEGILPGDLVLMSFNSCGNCTTCKRETPAYCLNMLPLNFGGTRLDKSHTMRCADGAPLYSNFFGQSSFSNLALVNKRCLVRVSKETPLSLFAPLGCGLQTGAGAILNTLNMQSGASVAVFGTGSVGMAAIMAAKIRKANIIIGVDIDEGRLEIARSIGATHCLNGSDSDIADQIRVICGGDGVNYAVDCTGVGAIIERMIDSLGTLGKAATIGAPAPGTKVSVDVLSQLTKGRQYVGCNQGDSIPQQMIPYLIEQHSQGNFPIEKIVQTYSIEDFALALEDMKSGKIIKPVLTWRC